jgi:type I restriction enzyme S subunit
MGLILNDLKNACELEHVCDYVNNRTTSSMNYISTENMLPNKGGISESTIIPPGTTTEYKIGDILISNIRPYFQKIWCADRCGGCSADVLCIRAKENTDSKYLYYLLSQQAFFDYVMSGAKGCKMPRGDKKQIMQWPVNIPAIDVQKKVVAILSSLDNKIRLNRRINDNLEEQAKALFKSWFVDSDRNEWVHYELGDITLITAGGDRPSKYTNKKTIECYVPIYSNGIDNEGLYGYTDVAKIHEESITISARGTIGYVCLRLEPYVPIVRLISIIPNKKELSAKYLYLWALTQNITGTGTTQQQLTVPIFRKTPISIPSDTKLKQFNSIADPLFSQIESNKKENIKLSTLRDTLLPKLMSGELSVEEVSFD